MLLEESDSQSWVLKALREAGNSIVAELSGLDEKVLEAGGPLSSPAPCAAARPGRG